MTTQSARLFFALWPTPVMQAALAGASTLALIDAEQAGSGVRPVPLESFHLTLAFLGSVPLHRLAEVAEIGASCARVPAALGLPIEVVLDCFDHWRKPQVLVATSRETPPAAIALAESLKRALVEGGFSPDLKPFRVHATVARKVRRVTRDLPLEPVRWRFDSLHLIESGSGSVYSTVQKWILDKRD